MPIDFTCSCGKHLHAPDGSQGRRARCPKCGAIVTVPDLVIAQPTEDELYDTVSAPEPAAPRAAHTPAVPPASHPISTLASPMLSAQYTAPRKSSLRRFTYFLLLLALIPLVLSTFLPREDHGDQLAEALDQHPELITQVEHGDLTIDQLKSALFATLPGDRVQGALLPHDTHAHWLIALAAAGFYFAFLLVAFKDAFKFTKGLLFAGIFTGTAGVILLLIFQWAAFSMPLIIPRGVVGLVLLVIKLIGYSYAMADNPDYGFLLSFIGFTCGVGLCEEICKAIPLLFRIKPTIGEEDPSWNSLLLWGLASGIGFGIAEGIMYSGRYYNGLEGPGIYYVRFLSCVALHAMWAGAVGVSVYRHQGDLLGADNNWTYFFHLIKIAIIPMVLHGLYDTLLKKDMDVLALVVVLATFAYLAYQIETQHRKEPLAATA